MNGAYLFTGGVESDCDCNPMIRKQPTSNDHKVSVLSGLAGAPETLAVARIANKDGGSAL